MRCSDEFFKIGARFKPGLNDHGMASRHAQPGQRGEAGRLVLRAGENLTGA